MGAPFRVLGPGFGRRPYRMVERRYIVQYVTHRYPDRITAFFNLRLGVPKPIVAGVATPEEYTISKPWAPFADAVVVLKDRIIVIEAKIRQPRTAIGQLIDYVRRVPATPQLTPYLGGRSIFGLLVTPFYDDEIKKTCEENGLLYDTFLPCWVLDYMVEVKLIPLHMAIQIKEDKKCLEV